VAMEFSYQTYWSVCSIASPVPLFNLTEIKGLRAARV